MLERIISRIFRGRHYWRSVSFDEVAELYASRLITIFAANTVNLFAAVYLYELGYSLLFIALFYAVWYAVKVPFSYVAAKYTAYFGPKHGILAANLLRIPSLIAFACVPVAGDNALLAIALFGFFQQISVALYDLSYMIDFSKVKHSEHAGKEIGIMQQVEKVARVLSPLAGGLVASVWSPQATIILASLLFIVAAMPLFRTVEPTLTRTKLRFEGFPWRLAAPSVLAESVVGFDFVASGLAWTLFITVTIFSGLGSSLYAALGGLASLGVFVSIVAAWTFGRLIDRHHGDVLMVLGTVFNAVLHLFRPFITTPAGVMTSNIVNESATSAYAMPFTRVMFDVADTSGFRTTYFMFVEMTLNIGAMLGCLVFAGCIWLFGIQTGFMVTFFIAAAYELIMLVSTRAAR